MITLVFLLDHQVITRTDKNVVVAGSRNYARARFISRSDDWAKPITAIFGDYTQMLDDKNECTVPWEVLQSAGKFEVSAFCGDLHTANTVSVPVEKTGYKSGETPEDPTPGVYEQLVKMAEEAVEVANSVREDADAGEFDGKTGPQGPQGPQGATGPAGLGVPSPAAGDAGKVPVVNADGTGYELGDAPISLDATLTQTGKAADAKATGDAIAVISPDDDAVNGKPWTSLKIVDTLCAPFTAEGNPVTCTPVEGYPLSVQASWEPRQEGTGDPSPENVRPITGLDEVTVTLSDGMSDGTTTTLALPETIYGGTVDAVTGEGVETVHGIVLDGTGYWAQNSGDNLGLVYFEYQIPNSSALLPSAGSNIAIAKQSQAISHFKIGNPYSENVDNAGWVYNTASNIATVRIRASQFENTEDWKSFLAAQAAAGTPVQVAYKLATPTAFQATGGQSLPALPGTNTVYTDADNVAVSGRADPVQTINALNDRIAALEDAAQEVKA